MNQQYLILNVMVLVAGTFVFFTIYLCRQIYIYCKKISAVTNTNQPWSVHLHDQTSTADLSTEQEEEVVIHVEGGGGDDDYLSPMQCVICLSGSEKDPLWMILRDCEHKFHYNCMCKWLNVDRSCPVCRNYVPQRHEW